MLDEYAHGGHVRRLEPKWNHAMIAASIAISFLGAFTSTQLMCHARMSLYFSSVLTWSLAGSVIFGFCSIWSLHEVAMLAYELDLPIGVDGGLTVLSSILAVLFTFAALSYDLLWSRWQTRHHKHHKPRDPRGRSRSRTQQAINGSRKSSVQSATPLLAPDEEDEDIEAAIASTSATTAAQTNSNTVAAEEDYFSVRLPSVSNLLSPSQSTSEPATPSFATNQQELMAFAQTIARGSIDSVLEDQDRSTKRANGHGIGRLSALEGDQRDDEELEEYTDSHTRTSSSDLTSFRRSSTGASSLGLSSALGMVFQKSNPHQNVFVATAIHLFEGLTRRNIGKGFLWSLAITGMHYCGMLSLKVPGNGYLTFNWWLVMLSGLISWIVCTVGCVLMAHMETQLSQQILFSCIAAAGVAAMHWTGMAATTFWSYSEPSDRAGYPPALASAVVAIAFITCIAANVLLAHSATVSRNKLAEIVWTRKELWKTIALKENAEAAASARSDFIASASHEIRTPLHHLQGYSDLLAQTELTKEGRELLVAIQRATKTLSLITNNVLDWSKFEREEGVYRPVALDLRAVCESVVVLLPNVDEDSHVELYVVVSPDVPKTLFLDETFIHRILMNLLSNALKFTRNGYILLSIEMDSENLIATVKDTGCGLEPSFIPEMWTPFKQGEVRGSARGTGLGLSIIKQLLKRMNGKIDVKSKYVHSEGVGPQNSGTTFTVTVAMPSTQSRPVTPASIERPKVAILARKQDRAIEGLQQCWRAFGFDPRLLRTVEELAHSEAKWRYIWADLEFLLQNPDQFEALMKKPDLLVLVPYDTHDSLEGLDGILTAPNFILLPKPLIWHTFDKRLIMKQKQRRDALPTQALRFATEVEVLDDPTVPLLPAPPRTTHTVLLVEDNLVSLFQVDTSI
jgi:signal transduction histidine kinase